MITCDKCGHQNPLGHVFCMRCRGRLDLKTHLDTKMLKGASPRRVGARQVMLIAVVFLIVLPVSLMLWPDSIKPGVGGSDDFRSACRKINLLDSVAGAPSQALTQGEVNIYMEAVVARARKLNSSGLVASRIRLMRVLIEQDRLLVQVARTLGPFMLGPLNLGSIESTYELAGVPEAGLEGFRFMVSSCKRGRLPMPGAFSGFIVADMEAFFAGLEKERAFLDRLGAIDLEDGEVVISMKPAR